MSIDTRKIWSKLNLDQILDDQLSKGSKEWDLADPKTNNNITSFLGDKTNLFIHKKNWFIFIVSIIKSNKSSEEEIVNISSGELLADRIIIFDVKRRRKIRKIRKKLIKNKLSDEEKNHLKKFPRNILRNENIDKILD